MSNKLKKEKSKKVQSKEIRNAMPVYRMWSSIFLVAVVLVAVIAMFICEAYIISGAQGEIRSVLKTAFLVAVACFVLYMVTSFVNMYVLHGEPILRIGKNGIYYDNELISYTDIEKVGYKFGVFTSGEKKLSNYLVIHMKDREINIAHAPRVVQLITIFNSNAKMQHDAITLIICVVCLLTIPITYIIKGIMA